MGYDPQRDQRERDALNRKRLDAQHEAKAKAKAQADASVLAKRNREAEQKMAELFAGQGLDEFGNPLSPHLPQPSVSPRGLTVLRERSGTYPVGTWMDLREEGFIGVLEFEHPEIDDLRALWHPNPGGPGRKCWLGVRWPDRDPGTTRIMAREDMSQQWRRFIAGGLAYPLEVRTDGQASMIDIRWLPPFTATRVTPAEARALTGSLSPWSDPPDTPPQAAVAPPVDQPAGPTVSGDVPEHLARMAALGVVSAAAWGLNRWRKRGQP